MPSAVRSPSLLLFVVVVLLLHSCCHCRPVSTTFLQQTDDPEAGEQTLLLSLSCFLPIRSPSLWVLGSAHSSFTHSLLIHSLTRLPPLLPVALPCCVLPACLPENGPAGAWGSAVAACLNTRINIQSQSTRGSTHTQTGGQCERGSAFPDVCCSFDLLLQLKLHPPPCLARLLPQQHEYKDSNHTLLAAFAPTPSTVPSSSTPHSLTPNSALLTVRRPCCQPLSTS
ncbi:Rho GTPase-activating protein 22/24/25 [Sarotherodon galilaeus]